MAQSLSVLFFFAFVVLAASAAQSVAFPSIKPFANTTSFSSGTITSSPSQTSPSPSINISCSSCVIAVDQGGLEQIFWFSQTWSVTLDTETVLGDIRSLNTTVPYIESLMMTMQNREAYFSHKPTLVRGTNGSVGTTSFPYGQPYAEVNAINYRYMLPNPDCPPNMGAAASEHPTHNCRCLMNTWFPLGPPYYSVGFTTYSLDRTYYQPLPSSAINESNAGGAGDTGSLEPWDGGKFKAWLAGNKAFKSPFPNWEDCAFWDVAAGPRAAKLPVAALTATISTTVHTAAASSSPPPKPVPQPSPPIPKPTVNAVSTPAPVPTAQPKAGQSGSGSGGDPGGSGSGGSESLGSHGGSGSWGNSGNSVSQASQGADESSGNSGNTSPTRSGGDTGLQGSGSGATGIGGHSSQGGSGSSGGANGSGIQGGGGTGSSDLSGSSGSVSDGGFSGSYPPPKTVPFVVTASDQTTASGTLRGSTAAVVAGNTISAEDPLSSTGRALISVHPGASSIAINGDSHPLPTPTPAPAAATLPAPIAIVGSHTINASPGASEVYYAGTTLSQNGPHVTIDNTEVFVGSSGLVIGSSSTVAIFAAPSSGSSSESVSSAMTFTAAGHTFTSSPSGIAVAGTTIQPGSIAVISGTTVSYGSSGLVIGTSIVPIPTSHPSSAGPASFTGTGPTNVFTLGGQTLTASPTGISITGTTLTAGGCAITISGTAISLGSSGLVIASSTYAIPSGTLPSRTTVIGSETFTIHPTAIEVAGTTLTSGGSAITIHGTPISLGSSGLIIASSTYAIPLPASTTVIGSETFTIRPMAIEVGGTTLSEGGNAITIHGTPVSLGPSGLIVAGSTIPIRSTTSEGLGGVILAGFGPSTTAAGNGASTGTSTTATGPGTSMTPGVVGFQGGATKLGSWGGMVI